MYFTCTFQLTNWRFSWHLLSFANIFPKNFNWIRSRLLFYKVLWFDGTWCFSFLHLNFMITQSFFLMWWQACRLSSSTDIPVNDSTWLTDCFRTSLAISDGTGLISRVSLMLYRALFRLLHSNWIIHSSRSSLQHLEKLITTFSSINSSFHKISNWRLVCTIVDNNKLER